MQLFQYSQAEKIILPIMIILLVLGSIFYSRLTKGTKLNKLPLKIITICLILTEILKQSYYLITNTYANNYIPLWFCSLFMPLLFLSEFMPEKISRYFKPMSFCYTALFTILLIIYPHWMWADSASGVFNSIPNFVAFNFHALLLMYFIYSLITLSYVPRKRDCLLLIICLLFYISFAIPAAEFLQVNYEWLLHSIYPPFENFRLQFGQLTYLLVYISLMCVIMCLILMVYYVIYQIITLIKSSKNAKF